MSKTNDNQQDIDRLIKVLSLARTATHKGERQAAQAAAQRLSQKLNIDLNDKNSIEHLLRQQSQTTTDGTDSDDNVKRQSATSPFADDFFKRHHAYASHYGAWSSYEYYARQQTMRARKKAKDFADHHFNQKSEHKKRPSFAPRYHRTYRQTEADKERLIMGLMRDNVPLQRIAHILNMPNNEVVRIWLHIRDQKNYRKMKR